MPETLNDKVMIKNFCRDDDVCIVGIGCVLPDADGPHEFWGNIAKGRCSIRTMPEERFRSDIYLCKNKKEKDVSYSNMAGFVRDDRLRKISKRLGLKFSGGNRLQIMAVEAVRQAVSCLRADSFKKARRNADVFLGSMEINEDLISERFFIHNKDPLRRYIKKSKLKDGARIFKSLERYYHRGRMADENAVVDSIMGTSTVNLIKKKFGIGGEGMLTDAACASSFVAIDAAVHALKSHETDLAIAGGMESGLGADTFVSFSKVGALSTGICLPFDKKTDGLSQGEGSAVFVLQRMKEARRDKNKIYGIIRSIGGSSDGKSSSLFSPSLNGQVLAYKRAYEDLDKKSVDYIECHGTGTKAGDAMEIRSLNAFFKGAKIPIGSVKALIGHTKSAAGAAGLLKCVLIMQNGLVPPSKYVTAPLAPKSGAVAANTRPIRFRKTRPMRLGVSSFGFGNINYHVVLDKYNGENSENETISSEKTGSLDDRAIVVVGKGSTRNDRIDISQAAAKFNILPQSIPHIDRIQLSALMAVDDAFQKTGIDAGALDRENVSVVSASSLGLDFAVDFTERIMVSEFKDALKFLGAASMRTMVDYRNRFPEVTEDTGPGILNNVIAGRICNVFDFNGKNFNVDSDFNSFPAALRIAAHELKKRGGIVLLVSCNEKLNRKMARIERNEVLCTILSTLSYAKKNNYPIRTLIRAIDYHD